ncbi:MAG: ADP-forming succinate--CoA ligase subunit beta [Hyphomicrobiaceae bacterium]|nr:ADP-forming succinate--CoA ligase subunit beta [Hyphomicrobiaceae bacterium]
MDLYEHQAKRLLSAYGIPIPIGEVATSVDGAGQSARRLGCNGFVVKAQILAGDRKQAGGIRFASNPTEVENAARALLGTKLVTRQTGSRAARVDAVQVEEQIRTLDLLYLAITIDPQTGTVVMLASRAGGDDIEVRASTDRDVVHRIALSLDGPRLVGDFDSAAKQIASEPRIAAGLVTVMRNLAAAFIGSDATLAEINPLCISEEGRLYALDAKVTIDDNALFRRPELARLKAERTGADPDELEAQRHQINYLKLDGSIGCVVNGAGLALTTLDLLESAGGSAANFMDIRTTATSLDIAHGFGLILANPAVRAIYVNVHGGGMQRCDTIAEGLGIALRKVSRRVPIVMRLAGNNAAFAQTVLRNNGVAYTAADDMSDGARLAVAAVRKEAA